MYDFDEIIDRKNTNSIKYDAGRSIYPKLPEKYLPMWVADMDFACPQPILDAMHRRLDKRILGYSEISDPAYFAAVKNWMERRHGWKIDADSIVYSSGIVEALYAAVEHLVEPGEGIIINTPAYHPFDDAAKALGRKAVYSPLRNENGYFTFDLEDFEKKAKDPSNKLFFLCNPHNPTGRVWKEDELRIISEICWNNNVFIVSDEIHADFLRKGQKHIPLAKLFPNEKRLITCTAPSKTFNLAGNQLSNIIFNDNEMAEKWRNFRSLGMPNPLSIDACIAAYDECEDWVDELNDYLDESFKTMKDTLSVRLPKAKLTDSEGTYLAWLDLSAFGFSLEEMKETITENGLFIEYADEFVADADGFVRINIACPRSIVERACDILVKSCSR